MIERKRFYYNTYYRTDDPSRVLEYEIIDRQSYPNYPNHDEEMIPGWYIYITENDSGWQDMLINLLNQLNDESKQLEKDVKCYEERIAILVELLDLADTIIDLGDDEITKEFWEKMNAKMDSKWEELIKKYKR